MNNSLSIVFLFIIRLFVLPSLFVGCLILYDVVSDKVTYSEMNAVDFHYKKVRKKFRSELRYFIKIKSEDGVIFDERVSQNFYYTCMASFDECKLEVRKTKTSYEADERANQNFHYSCIGSVDECKIEVRKTHIFDETLDIRIIRDSKVFIKEFNTNFYFMIVFMVLFFLTPLSLKKTGRHLTNKVIYIFIPVVEMLAILVLISTFW